MSMFRDDFYSTRPSRRAVGRRREAPDRMLWFAIALFVISVVLLTVTLLNGSQDQPASSLPNASSDHRGSGIEDGKSGDSPVVDDSSPDRGIGEGSSGSDPVTNGPVNDGFDAAQYRSAIAAATAKAYDAVVSIVTPAEEGTADWQDVYAIGSGIIFRVAGDTALIVTNHHVASATDELQIVLSTGEKKHAELIGGDSISDLAVLMTDSEGITQTAIFGSSNNLQVGEPAIAIGNPLGLGYAHTITSGIISSTHLRSIPVSLSGNGSLDWEMEVIQTDAAINSGNSGGALINIHGEVIGINTMKIAWFGVEGLGFAIPIDTAVPVIEELIEKGRVSRPYIGIGAVNLNAYMGDRNLNLPDEVTGGAVIMSVDGPAQNAGIREYDVIVKLDETEVRDMIDVRKYLYYEKEIGDPIEVTVYRNGRERTYSFELGELPE